jgi:hypothetical protein
MIPTNNSEPKHLRIDATMKASIHSEVRFFTNGGKI